MLTFDLMNHIGLVELLKQAFGHGSLSRA
jgi:hypothetical protein